MGREVEQLGRVPVEVGSLHGSETRSVVVALGLEQVRGALTPDERVVVQLVDHDTGNGACDGDAMG